MDQVIEKEKGHWSRSSTIKEGKLEKEPLMKKMKVEESNNTLTCKHFVVRKKRFCKMTVAKGKEYCGEHCPPDPEASHYSPDGNGNDRIPCPLDIKHTVYRKNLKKHLRICNAKPKDNPDYIVPGINAGSDIEKEDGDCKNIIQIENLKLLFEQDEETMKELIIKIENIYNKFVKSSLNELILNHEILLDELTNEKYGQETRKHLIQTSSILGCLKHFNMLEDNTGFIEFGAGKGQVSYWLSQVINNRKNSKVILIDKASHRHKKDNKIEDKNYIHRIRADIADFDIRKLDILDNILNIVAVSKHLCGAATDLTLRCLTLKKRNNNEVSLLSIKCFIIALCCHHRCEWKSFVGKKFFNENSLTKKDFAIMIKMVSWAVCGTGYSRERRKEIEIKKQEEDVKEDIGRKVSLTKEQKEKIGLMCKRILDYSRLKYMEDNGFECSLKYYVKSNVTLENVCLIGFLKK